MTTTSTTTSTSTTPRVTTVAVATDVCPEFEYPCFPITMETSLCAAGWPQAAGNVALTLYGPRSSITQQPCTSYLFGTASRRSQFCAIPKPDGVPLEANHWFSIMKGWNTPVTPDGYYNEYEARFDLYQINPTTVTINLVFYKVEPDGSQTICFTYNKTLTETSPTPDPYRNRGYVLKQIPISWNKECICADPQSFMDLSFGTTPWLEGCGSAGGNLAFPPCGLYYQGKFHSCLRWLAVPTTTPIEFVPKFFQAGFNIPGCGAPGAAYCYCDTIQLKSLSPLTGKTTFNKDPQFVVDYGKIGVPGEDINVIQEVQISTFGPIEIVAKKTNQGLFFATKLQGATTYVVSAAVIAQQTSPRVFRVDRPTFTAYGYTMEFPNEGILPPECIATTTPIPCSKGYLPKVVGDGGFCPSGVFEYSPVVLSVEAVFTAESGIDLSQYGVPSGTVMLGNFANPIASCDVVTVLNGQQDCTTDNFGPTQGASFGFGSYISGTLTPLGAVGNGFNICGKNSCTGCLIGKNTLRLYGIEQTPGLPSPFMQLVEATCNDDNTWVLKYNATLYQRVLGNDFNLKLATVLLTFTRPQAMQFTQQTNDNIDWSAYEAQQNNARSNMIQQFKDVWGKPCIHLGQRLEDVSSCGCSGSPKYACAKHGECRRYSANRSERIQLCVPRIGETCPDYVASQSTPPPEVDANGQLIQ